MLNGYDFVCPECGVVAHFTEPREKDSESFLDFVLFGIVIAAILYWFDWAGRVECGECGAIVKRSKMRSAVEKETGQL